MAGTSCLHYANWKWRSTISGQGSGTADAAIGAVLLLHGFGDLETEHNETPCRSFAPEKQMLLPQCFVRNSHWEHQGHSGLILPYLGTKRRLLLLVLL